MPPDSVEVIPAGYVKDLTPLKNIQYQDAAIKKIEESKDRIAKRQADKLDHIYGLWRNGCLTVVGVLIAGVALVYAGTVIANPNSSAEMRQFAFTIWGTIIGATGAFLFGEAKSKPAAKKD